MELGFIVSGIFVLWVLSCIFLNREGLLDKGVVGWISWGWSKVMKYWEEGVDGFMVVEGGGEFVIADEEV